MKKISILILLLIQVCISTGQQPVPQDDKSRISVLEYQVSELKAHNTLLQQQLEQSTDKSFKQLEERLELKSTDVAFHGRFVDWVFFIITVILALAAIGVFVIFKSKFEELKKLKKQVEDDMKLLKDEAEKTVDEIKANKDTSDKLLKLSPNVDSINSNIGNNEEAIKAILDNPTSSEFEIMYARAVNLFNDNNYAASLTTFQSMLKTDAHQIGIELRSMIYTYISYCYTELEKLDLALSYADASVNLDPGNKSAWNNKGISLANKDDYDAAIICFDRAIELGPKYNSAWYNKGNSLGKKGDCDAAIDCYNKAIELNPKNNSAWYNKGVSLGKKDDYDAAIDCYEKAIELNPRDEKAWNNKGFSLGKKGDYAGAIACYEKAIELNPKNENALNNKEEAIERLKSSNNL